jgi:hypothetical protein
MHKLYRVTGFQIVAPYTLRIGFDDGTLQTIDFLPILEGNMYGPLRDLQLFNQVHIDPYAHTLAWPNGADFDPETLRNWNLYRDAWIDAAQMLKQRNLQPA